MESLKQASLLWSGRAGTSANAKQPFKESDKDVLRQLRREREAGEGA